METVVAVTEHQYREILHWEDDGGAHRNIIYQIIRDKDAEAEVSELVVVLSPNTKLNGLKV